MTDAMLLGNPGEEISGMLLAAQVDGVAGQKLTSSGSADILISQGCATQTHQWQAEKLCLPETLFCCSYLFGRETKYWDGGLQLAKMMVDTQTSMGNSPI